jgi:hypothetical protein
MGDQHTTTMIASSEKRNSASRTVTQVVFRSHAVTEEPVVITQGSSTQPTSRRSPDVIMGCSVGNL